MRETFHHTWIGVLSPDFWAPLFGFGLFVGMMAVGYYYNLTFIQLGLIDLGERQLGLSRLSVANQMALLALLTCGAALGFGWWMNARGWGARFRLKLRLAFLVVGVQTLLTFTAPGLHSRVGFVTWIVVCSLALGVGVPVTFSLTVDLVPVARRGLAAALVAASAYLAANLVPQAWTINEFALPLQWIMPGGVLALGLLAFPPPGFSWLQRLVERLAQQNRLPSYAAGRFTRSPSRQSSAKSAGFDRRLLGPVVFMFGIFFVDSLGFLRLLETPRFMQSAWQSPTLDARLVIGGMHVIGALVGGVLYAAINPRRLFYWIFGIFALVHLEYTLSLRIGLTGAAPLSMPVLYALAVSLYTVVNFAIWADFSMPQTIGFNAALGVALSGWTATFLSTALAIRWEMGGMPLERHLSIVDALAMLFFLGMVLQAWFPRRQGHPGEEGLHES